MGRQMQDGNSDSYRDNRVHREYTRSLLHIIKHHPLCHDFIKRHGYKKGSDEKSAAGIVLAQRYEAFSDEKKNLSLDNTRNNVEEKATPHSETVLTDQSARIKKCAQYDATPSSENQPTKNGLLPCKVKGKKQCRVVGNSRKHTSGASINLHKHFVGVFKTNNMNKDLLLTFRCDPVSPLFYHFHKQQAYRAKVTITRSVSCPLPNSSSKSRGYPIGNGSLPNGQRKLHNGNRTQKWVQFESSKRNCELAMPLVAKWRVDGNFDMNEAFKIRYVQFSSGSGQCQNQKEIKYINNLKKKIEHVTKESRNEKLRVVMDSVIHKLPQGNGLSHDLKMEILKKLTEPIVTREGEYSAANCNVNDPSTFFIPKNNWNASMRRIWSLQEPLESYCQHQGNSFKTATRYPQSEEPKLRTEKAHSPLRIPIPLQRILSLPDLQSFSYASQNEKNSDISSFIKKIIASGDGNVSSESVAYQLDTLVEGLTLENNDLLIRNIERSGLDCMSKINDNSGSFNVNEIGPIKEYKAAKGASDSGPFDRPDNVADKQEANIDTLKLNETTENTQRVQILTKQLNNEIPSFHVDERHKEEINYVKYVLEISGMTSNNGCLSAWHSKETPVDPLLYKEMESDPDFCTYESGQCNHHVLFDLINETLLEIYGRSNCYPPIKFSSHMSNTLHQVWTHMSKSLCLTSKAGQTIDNHVSRDLAKSGELMNIQFYAQNVGLELEELIFQDLLEEIMLDLTLL